MSASEEAGHIHTIQGYLHKKEEGSRWVQYWALLQGQLLKFHTYTGPGDGGRGGGGCEGDGGPGNLRLIGWIEITAESKCIQGKKKSYGCSFYIEKQKRRYLFKTDNLFQRQQWIDAIESTVQELSGCADKILVQQYIMELANRAPNTDKNIKFTRHEKGRLRESHDTVSTTCSNKENHDTETYAGDDLCDMSATKCCDACTCRDDDVTSVASSVPSCCGVYDYGGGLCDDLATRRLVSEDEVTEKETLLAKCAGLITAITDDTKTILTGEEKTEVKIETVANDLDQGETTGLLTH